MSTEWSLGESSDAERVRARIAALLEVGALSASPRVGEFTLRSAQHAAHDRILRALEEFGGAVLLDPPGSGKTIVALAVAATLRARRALVIGPAVVRTQWLATATRAGIPIVFQSLESLSRHSPTSIVSASPDLIIIDEAHHLRTPQTRRYAAAARLCAQARALALSATPVVNRRADLITLLRLFLGARADWLTPAALGRCLVRRTDIRSTRPAVRRGTPLPIAPPPEWLAASLRTLPAPWPMVGTQTPLPLITMSLAMAWQSSLAALHAALRRREQRGAALLDLLAAGVIPTERAVRAWTMDEDATQLAFPLLADAGQEQSDVTAPPVDLMRTTAQVQDHLEAVRAIRQRLAPSVALDTACRVDALRGLLARFPDSRIALLSQRTETIRALYHALRGEPGVIAIVGPRVLAAAGRWSRDAVLRGLGPQAPQLRRDDLTMIRLLLATDVLAEGIELQGVQVLVHADLPWTPARLEQRLGRLTRVGASASEVQVMRFAIPAALRPLLQLGCRLRTKAVTRTSSVQSGRDEEEVMRHIARWSSTDADTRPGERATLPSATSSVVTAVGAVCSNRDGFLAVVRIAGRVRLLGGRPLRSADGTRWRVTEDPSHLLALCRNAEGPSRPVSHEAQRRAIQMIRRWDAAQRVRALMHPAASAGDAPRRLQRRLHRMVERAPALHRAAFAERAQRLIDRARGRLTIGQERALLDALTLDDARCIAGIEAMFAMPTPAGIPVPAGLGAPTNPRPDDSGIRVEALLLIGPRETPAAAPTYAPVSAVPHLAVVPSEVVPTGVVPCVPHLLLSSSL